MQRSFSKWIVRVVQVLFALLALYEIWTQDWMNLFIVAQAMLIGFVPFFIKRNFSVHTPYLLRAGIVVFMFATLVLGEMADFYNRFEWWDLILHGIASMGLTLIGFLLLVHSFARKELRSTPFMTTFLAFSISMTFAVIWEVYEFIIDSFFTTDSPMQPSNTDTMTDLMIAIAGAIFVGLGGYRYLKGHKRGVIARLIKEGEIGAAPTDTNS